MMKTQLARKKKENLLSRLSKQSLKLSALSSQAPLLLYSSEAYIAEETIW